MNETHRERSKLQDKLEFALEDWDHELDALTKKQLEELNAKVDQDNTARDIIQQLRATKGQVVELMTMQTDSTKQVEINNLKEKLIKEIMSDFKDIERKYKESK